MVVLTNHVANLTIIDLKIASNIIKSKKVDNTIKQVN